MHRNWRVAVHNAVAEVVRHQVDVGIDIISDGEQSNCGDCNTCINFRDQLSEAWS